MRARWLVGLMATGLMGLLLVPEPAQTGMYQDDNQALKDRARPHIERGLAFLRGAQKGDGSFAASGAANTVQSVITVGATALCGIAMLECDVPPTDSAVVRAANYVRSGVTASGFNYNYSVTLSIMFLERLKRTTGKTNDDKLIKSLTTLVVNSQSPDGGWGYNLVPRGGGSDNSNTQFAVVALWMGRKHGVQGLEDALAKAAQRFRNTQQQKDGGWVYDPSIRFEIPSSGSMTCAGCLVIALHAGIKQQASFRSAENDSGDLGEKVMRLNEDPAIAAARTFLARRLLESRGADSEFHPPVYYLWSMERLCKILHWKKINDVDWFKIGLDFLLPKQKQSGAWDFGQWGAPVDTSFALLFLAQSNLLGDLFEERFKGGEPLINTVKTAPAPPTKAEMKQEKAAVSAKELAKKLIAARAEERGDILSEFELVKGTDYSYELAKAIPELPTNQAKVSAREVLAKRMTRQSVKVLEAYLKEDDQELRLAAAKACGLKNDKETVPILIPLLEDRDVAVQDAALDSLRTITKQNHGKSIARWQRWYDNQKK